MRIEIFANGVSSVSQLQSGLSDLHSSISATIEDLRAVNRRMSNLSGGLGNLSGAYQSVNSRIAKEESRLAAVERVSRASSTFLSNTVCTDSRVARLVNQSQERFFDTHPWLRPVVTEEKSWWEQRVEDWNNFWNAAGEVWKSVCDGVVDWVKKHAVEIIIGAVAIVVGAAIVALTGGAAAAFIPALLAGLKAAAISAVISGAISATIAALTGGDVLTAFGDGLASGFMWGGIFYAVGSIFTSVKTIASNLRTKNVQTYPKEVLNNLSSPDATDFAVDHIYKGQISRGRAVGYHYNMIEGTEGKIIEGTQKRYFGGIYEAEVEVSGVTKRGFSTFFPDSMSPNEVWTSINEAFQNKAYTGFRNVWIGKANSGMKIKFFLKDGKFFDAFPVAKFKIPIPKIFYK